MNKIVMVLATYGVIHVLAADLGMKTNKAQYDIVHQPAVQFLLLYSGAYSVVEDHTLASLATGLYYFLKYTMKPEYITNLNIKA